MGDNPRGIKKSLFSILESIPAGSYFDFVVNNTNYRITIENMVSEFGTTGTLEQLGSTSAFQILNKVATVNQIRGLEEGNGIQMALGPEGGVEIAHAFVADETGVPALVDILTANPKIRSFAAGTGLAVASVNGQIRYNLTDEPVSNKTVPVDSMDDFPAAVSGVRTLDPDTLYLIRNDLTTGDRFVLQEGTIVSGSDGTLITLTYTGTSTMFTSSGNSNKIRDIILVASATGSKVFDITCGSGTCIFQVLSSRIICDTIGTIGGVLAANFMNVLWTVATDGITFTGNNSIISFSSSIGTVSGGTFLDLGTSTFDGLSFIISQLTLATGATLISGATDSANVNAGGLATVLNTRVSGAGTAISGITTQDALWEFFANNGIDDSRNSLVIKNPGTTVTAPTVYTIIGATWTSYEASRFTSTAGGRFTYTGKGAFISFHASISATVSSGTNINCTFSVFKNGVQVTGTDVSRDFISTSIGNFSMFWGLQMDTNDYLEVFVINNDSSANVVVDQATVRLD